MPPFAPRRVTAAQRSPRLCAHGGQVWTLDGRLPVDLLDPRPWQVPDLFAAPSRWTRLAAHPSTSDWYDSRRTRDCAGSASNGQRPQCRRFAIALFAGVDRTAVDQKVVSLDALLQLLSKFEVLADKHRGRCWSPIEYPPGHTARANTGVAAVSALVFDMDKVPPEPERLIGVYWLGHTTYSAHAHSAAAGVWSFH